MELKNFFAQDTKGNVVPFATVAVYNQGTTVRPTIYGVNGSAITNPFNVGNTGLAQFRAANGEYDVKVITDDGEYTLTMQCNDVVDTVAAAEAAADRAEQAVINGTQEAQQLATTQANRSEQEADRAETARDAAQLTAGVYADTTAGLGATIEGDYFSVPSAESDEYLILYRHDAGPAATEIKRYPAAQRIQALEEDTSRYRNAGDPVRVSNALGYAWTLEDEAGRIGLGVKEDGKVVLSHLEAGFDLGSHQVLDNPGGEYVWSIEDKDGRIAFAVKSDGSVVWAKDATESPGLDAVPRNGGRYTHDLNYINNTGQSLGEGSDGAITTSQEFDNVGFPARSSSPTSYAPLTVDNTQASTRGESPMYGTCGHIKALVAAENGYGYQDMEYQLLACNNAYGGTPIADLKKGGSEGAFEDAISQVQAGYDIAAAEGRTFAFQAVTWTQGENDTVIGTTEAAYMEDLLQLAEDYNADGKAITGQFNDVAFITYQTCRDGGQATVASAQLRAANSSRLIYMAGPHYHLSHYDFQHIDALSSKWLGGYYGLVYKRVVIDQEDWQPLQPVRHSVIGNTIDLFFNKTGLTLDTDNVPMQPDYGFSVVDEGNQSVAVSSVSVIEPNRVRIVCASAPSAGWKVRYAWNSAVDRTDAYTGGCGNLRDNQGDFLIYEEIGKPLHNWCVIFNYEV